jgi:glutaredoxin-like protein
MLCCALGVPVVPLLRVLGFQAWCTCLVFGITQSPLKLLRFLAITRSGFFSSTVAGATVEVMSAQITMYWRPGCGFCAALQRNLDRLEVSYEKVNIWDSPEAAEFVRSVARGNETVPTVTVGDKSMVNPSAQEVLEAVLLATEAAS